MRTKFLERAIELAREKSADGQNGPFGAVVVRNNTIVGEGWNRVVKTNDPTAHAEVTAIRNACRQLNTYILIDCELYCSSEPCPMCLAAIYWARIRSLYFACNAADAAEAGFDDTMIYEQIALDWPSRSITVQQGLRDKGIAVLRQWIDNPRKVPY
jgi:tRNA(Arg) A34 adenosine deaminase TadA